MRNVDAYQEGKDIHNFFLGDLISSKGANLQASLFEQLFHFNEYFVGPKRTCGMDKYQSILRITGNNLVIIPFDFIGV